LGLAGADAGVAATGRRVGKIGGGAAGGEWASESVRLTLAAGRKRVPAGASRLGMHRRFSWVELTKCRCSEIVPGDPNTRYGKLLTRLTAQRKPPEMAIIRASCGWRDPAVTAPCLPLRDDDFTHMEDHTPAARSNDKLAQRVRVVERQAKPALRYNERGGAHRARTGANCHLGSSSPACSRTMYSAYRSGQFGSGLPRPRLVLLRARAVPRCSCVGGDLEFELQNTSLSVAESRSAAQA